MPDALAGALAQDGLVWLVVAALTAGLVRGFAGFGTAMIYMPVAGQVLGPFGALATLTIMDVIGPIPLLPRAWREADRRDMLRLALGLVVAMPVGLWFLGMLDPKVFRYGVSLIALGLLVLLIAGVRYRGRLTPMLVSSTGALGGFLGGLTGLAGPPVIMLYMASSHAARVVRANLILYLMSVDLAMMALLAGMGRFTLNLVVLGVMLAIPFLVGNVIGARIFRPEYERAYRVVAYAVIAASALMGLPLLDR
jgi:uncharacterized membrane protein YfcA